MSNVITTVTDHQIRTHALQIAMARAASLATLDEIINDAKMVEMFIKFGTTPNLVKPVKGATDFM